ncbi:8147_t:CDS:2 [Diversispora eburnea]|uniref:8147_t:CDS:1 n=1 Tax=Diversispora eburnea TaxID=1213867 RepID=A0A9N9BYG6_9GLOM|nr:8147_t:CDS:2 [Diversispora eburnea]
MEIPLQTNKTVDILKVLKSAVRIFDQNTIALGSTHAYKSSNNLWVDSKQNAKVSRESVYNAEMYRILHNWLVKVRSFEVIGQWHLKTILELLATASPVKLDIHFEQVFKYTERLNPLEAWVIHFSCEDDIIKDSYWPSNELRKKELNVAHFWHNKNFKNVKVSSRSLDVSGNFQEIIDEQILPFYDVYHTHSCKLFPRV